MKLLIFGSVLLLSLVKEGLGLWCYRCAPSMPGCEPFNWRGMSYLGTACPEDDDICVKLIERKGSQVVVTRDCLSSFAGVRTDIPTDSYEGCRPSSIDIKLAHYVNSSIKEIDVKRDHYDQTTWCLCKFDHRCNGASSIQLHISIASIAILSTLIGYYLN